MRIVQFMHPGAEISVRRNQVRVPWNTGKHRRRLLRHTGLYVDGNNAAHEGELCFWNEYEAPTDATAITRTATNYDYAHHYHCIVNPISLLQNQIVGPDTECCSNTDPCVFGDTFKYSNCQQKPNGDLWNIPQGSLILFGSHHAGWFYLDTVFVTGDAGIQYFVPIVNHPLPFTTSDEYKIVTLNNLKPNQNSNAFMFYRGKLPSVNASGLVADDEIFSFTPARIFNCNNYNERCKIDLAALNARFQRVNGWRNFSLKLTQNHKVIVFNAAQGDVVAVWQAVRNMVIRSSFVLGYRFPW